jgi:hypothetical protein
MLADFYLFCSKLIVFPEFDSSQGLFPGGQPSRAKGAAKPPKPSRHFCDILDSIMPTSGDNQAQRPTRLLLTLFYCQGADYRWGEPPRQHLERFTDCGRDKLRRIVAPCKGLLSKKLGKIQFFWADEAACIRILSTGVDSLRILPVSGRKRYFQAPKNRSDC